MGTGSRAPQRRLAPPWIARDLRVSLGPGRVKSQRPGSKPAELSPAGPAACPQCWRECRNFVRCSKWESVPRADSTSKDKGPRGACNTLVVIRIPNDFKGHSDKTCSFASLKRKRKF